MPFLLHVPPARCSPTARMQPIVDILQRIWDVIWFFFWTFAFLAYLMAIFSIIGGLFRDHKLGAFAKAIWRVFLVFLPFITAIIYLIAGGTAMGERPLQAVQRLQEFETQRIRSIDGVSSADEISKASSLFQSGSITAEEYASLKEKALR